MKIDLTPAIEEAARQATSRCATAIAAQALRDAADEFPVTDVRATMWLHNRADRIERGET